MEDIIKQNDTSKTAKNRPIFLSVLCFIIFTYCGVLIILFLSGIFNISWITKMLNEYSQEISFSITEVLFYSILGLLVFSVMFFGAIKLWYLKKYGFYAFSISNLIIIAFQIFTSNFNWFSIIISLLFIFLFSLFYKFYR
ncbi:MAG: hypothetical protein JEY97_05445 [Bacteroidales bacterium]|nr:hypothetical protein [Bacteroidales bacterium]